jgi:soluble lytic murein transglycosylase-like protein
LFEKHAGRLPVPFLRALAKRESNMDPNDTQGPAWGLMQVVEVVRNSWNQRKPGQAVSRPQLLDPNTNVKIATDLLNRIAGQYTKHPDPNMKPDWSNPEFVKLLVAGWNSGYSEAGGVGRVARYLRERGIPVTHDNVFRYASAAGATKHLQNPGRQRWQRSVADLYFRQPDAPAPGEHSLGSFILKLSVAVLAGVLISRYVFK